MSTFTVRPSNSEKETFRVKLTATSLLSLKLKPGDIVLLQLPNDEQNTPKPAIAWENSGSGMKDTIIQASKTLQELYGFKLGDRIGIVRSTEALKEAGEVIVRSVSSALSDQDRNLWTWALSAIVSTKHDILAPGQRLLTEVGYKKEEFEVLDVGGLLGRITENTQFSFNGTSASTNGNSSTNFALTFMDVGGLQSEIDQITKQVRQLLGSDISANWPRFRGRHGLLLYGPKGTGKTVFQDSLANNPWASVVRWTPGVKLPTAAFPRLIIADLSDLAGALKGVSELLAIFKEIQGTPTLVVSEARHPNDISERLRTKNAFSIELELPIPDSEKRLDILRVLRGDAVQPNDNQLVDVAARTHGFVGADLEALLEETWITAWERARRAETEIKSNGDMNAPLTPKQATVTEAHNDDRPADNTASATISITQADIDQSLTRVRPSALQEIFLEKPNVRWTDIGGQHALKHQLTTAVNRTLSSDLRQRMSRLGLEVTKGVLLYGPPGCSKTLLAKALATEAELNFLAVKGAELISMYVGESERATREVFRKARAAAPSILFFDEIDAIASRASSASGRSGSDLNVLTTLLNEMDGFEELRNVIVIAATNKPQDIDPALLRPGRFDNVVYVGLPDVDTRREIFEKRFRAISVEDGVRGNIDGFAQRTEGFSGAEVVAICKTAGEYAFDADRDAIALADVEKAIVLAPRGITKEMLDEYARWNASRGVVA